MIRPLDRVKKRSDFMPVSMQEKRQQNLVVMLLMDIIHRQFYRERETKKRKYTQTKQVCIYVCANISTCLLAMLSNIEILFVCVCTPSYRHLLSTARLPST